MFRRILLPLSAAASVAAATPALAAGDHGTAGEKHDCTCQQHMAGHDHQAAPQTGPDSKKTEKQARESLIQSDADWRNSLNGSNGG